MLDGFPPHERFEGREILGRGASGVVFRAFDRELGQEVALKTIPRPSPEDLFRLKDEFRLVAGVSHPNLVELHELFVRDEHSFFTMDLVEGTDFLTYAGQSASLEQRIERLVPLLPQLFGAIEALHGRKLRHGDIKPPNVLVTGAGRVALLDFGLASTLERGRRFDQPGFSGTLQYMAPEAMDRRAVAESDWFSAGILLYGAISGRLPFEGSGIELLLLKQAANYRRLPELVPSIPPWLCRLVDTLLEPAPKERAPALELVTRNAGAPIVFEAQPTPLFAGREAELTALRAAFDRLKHDRALITVRLSGPSGIGKSTLLERFASEVDPEALVLQGRCHPYETVPYNAMDVAIDELSRHLFRVRDEARVLFPEDPGPLLRMFPVLRRALRSAEHPPVEDSSSPQELVERGADGLAHLLRQLGERGPLVLIIDDVQWGDSDSARLLRRVLRRADAPRLLLILAHRSGDAGHGQFLRDLDEQPFSPSEEDTLTLELSPLGEPAARQLARQLLGEDGARAEEIAREAAGSPFLIGELARHHRSADGTSQPAGDLSRLLELRLERLGPVARRTLELVALASAPLPRPVAVSAAESDRNTLRRLEYDCLLRSTSLGDSTGLLVYHDRIRQALIGGVEAPRRKTLHGSLAAALEQGGTAEPEVLAFHHSEAGDLGRAAGYAIRAAERARSSLAFERAAALYAQAITWTGEDSRALRAERAHCLFNAGRTAEAGPEFLAAATGASTDERRELQRWAVESYLLAGKIDDGVDAARPLLKELGASYPATPTRALVSVIGRVLRLRMRGTKLRPPGAIDPARAARVDLQWSLTKGLIYVHTIQGTHFLMESLLGALELGDPHRAGRALASTSALLFPVPGMGSRAASLMQQAERLAEESGEAYLRGAILVWSALKAFMAPNWPEVRRLAESSLEIFRTECVGTHWEQVVAAGLALLARQWMGDYSATLGESKHWREACAERGDLYGQTLFAQNEMFSLLASGDLKRAREEARWMLSVWTRKGYTIQHFYGMVIEARCALLEGRPEVALERFEQDRPIFMKAGFYRSPITRSEGNTFEAQCLLALHAKSGDRSLLKRVEKLAVSLERNKRGEAPANGATVRASLASLRGDAATARAALEHAVREYDRLHLGMYASIARRRLAELTSDGRALADADAWMRANGLGDPERWSAHWIPLAQARV